jgi:Protein of unknown function (DUF3644)
MAETKQKSAGRRRLARALAANARSAMFAAVEIHNKPVFQYRYEVCTLLVINAWELALKAYIAQDLKSVRLIKKDGTTKPFVECVACVSSKLGKTFEAVKQSLEILYEFRNKVAHFYQDDLGIVILGLLKSSVLFFGDFMEEHFGIRLYEEANLILLPIGFNKPMSPLDFLSNQSAAKECSDEVKAFLESIKKSAESLQKQGISDSIVVNYTIGLVNESRIKNADLTAAINNALPQGNVISVYNVISAANLTNDPAAKLLRLSEENQKGNHQAAPELSSVFSCATFVVREAESSKWSVCSVRSLLTSVVRFPSGVQAGTRSRVETCKMKGSLDTETSAT